MSDIRARAATIVHLDEAPSYWQPVPANGFVRNLLNKARTGAAADFSMGTQTVAPGCCIREHTHEHQEEVIHLLDGRGIARVEGVDAPMEKGTTIFIPKSVRHHFLNPHEEPMTFLWLLMPGGLDSFFAEIGRLRTPGEAAPAPFPRPANIAEIERRTVFGWTDQRYDPKT